MAITGQTTAVVFFFLNLRKEALHTFLGVGVDVISIIKDPDIVFAGAFVVFCCAKCERVQKGGFARKGV